MGFGFRVNPEPFATSPWKPKRGDVLLYPEGTARWSHKDALGETWVRLLKGGKGLVLFIW